MGPALASKHTTDGLVWAQCSPYSMLPMVLHGPSAGPTACYRWSSMGPTLAPKHAIDGLVLAQHWPPKYATNGLAWAQDWPPKHATDGLAWAQCWPHSMLPMILHGPSASHQASYQWSCMGPVLATKRAIDDLV